MLLKHLIFLDLLFRNISNVTNAKLVEQLTKAKIKINEGSGKPTKLIQEIDRIRTATLVDGYLSGDPFTDWLKVRKELEMSTNGQVAKIATTARQMRYLRRGTQITDVLSSDWRINGSYLNALSDFDNAVFQAQIADDHTPHTGVVVMNIHKSKGKEFDGVILVDGMYGDSLIAYDESPFTNSKRLMRVGLTRAKIAAYILTCQQYPCEILP